MKTPGSVWVLPTLFFSVVLASVGCADIIGIGQPPADGSGTGGGGGGDGLEPDKSGVRTSAACKKYCDDMEANCTGEFEQYPARIACVRACNTWDEGTLSEPSGNTVACHAKFASTAKSSPDETCATAGPAGLGQCGGKCENWCGLLAEGCPERYAELGDCVTACAALPVSSTTFSDANQDGNNIECRVYHANAALENADAADVHCPHANFMPSAVCIDTSELTCQVYCENAMGACLSDKAVYDSVDDCLAACKVFPLGTVDDKTQNTVGCRRYHSYVSLSDPGTHCPHASPAGGGHCGTYLPANDITGNCESYCKLYEAACPGEFTSEHPDPAQCPVDCKATFANRGAVSDGVGFEKFRYDVNTATSMDSVQCRTYYAVKILGDQSLRPTLCPNVTQAAVCPQRPQ